MDRNFINSICDVMDVIQQITLILDKNVEYRKNTTRFELFETARNWGIEFSRGYYGDGDFDNEIQLFINSKLYQLNHNSVDKVISESSSHTIESECNKNQIEIISFDDNLKSDIKLKYNADKSISNKLTHKNTIRYLVAYLFNRVQFNTSVVRVNYSDKLNSDLFRSRILKTYQDLDSGSIDIRILSWSRISD